MLCPPVIYPDPEHRTDGGKNVKKRHAVFQLCLLGLTLLVFGGYLFITRQAADRVAPEITITQGVAEFSVTEGRQAYLQGVSAYDDRDGDVTDHVIVENVYGIDSDRCATVTYAAFDQAGNVSTAERTVRFADYHSPRFVLKTALVFPEDSSIDVMDYIGAEDVFDGDIVRWVRATLTDSSGTLSEVGKHEVLLQVTNSLGDTAELVLPAEVHAAEKYNARLELSAYLLYLPTGASFRARDYLSSMTYAGTTHSLRASDSDFSVSISGDVDTQTPGLYPVTYTVRRTENGTDYTALSRLFVVVEGSYGN